METFLLYFQKRQACCRETHWLLIYLSHYWVACFLAIFMYYLLIFLCPTHPLSKPLSQKAIASLNSLGTISNIAFLSFHLFCLALCGPQDCLRHRPRNFSHYASVTSTYQKEPEEEIVVVLSEPCQPEIQLRFLPPISSFVFMVPSCPPDVPIVSMSSPESDWTLCLIWRFT